MGGGVAGEMIQILLLLLLSQRTRWLQALKSGGSQLSVPWLLWCGHLYSICNHIATGRYLHFKNRFGGQESSVKR